MYHSSHVSEGHGVADFQEDAEQFAEGVLRDHLGFFGSEALDDVGQGNPLHQLHRVVDVVVGVHAEVVNGHDAGVLQLPGDPGLFDEAQNLILGDLLRVEDHLHCDVALDVQVTGFKNGSHAALGQHGHHIVLAFVLAGQKVCDQGAAGILKAMVRQVTGNGLPLLAELDLDGGPDCILVWGGRGSILLRNLPFFLHVAHAIPIRAAALPRRRAGRSCWCY